MSMSDCHWTSRDAIAFMGYKIRTENMSMTQWVRWNGSGLRPIWDNPVGIELYTHQGDDGMVPAAFDDFENENLAGRPEFAHVQAILSARMRQEVERWIFPFGSGSGAGIA